MTEMIKMIEMLLEGNIRCNHRRRALEKQLAELKSEQVKEATE